MALQHLRSGTAHKRPIPTAMSAGQIAINTNEASPGLFFKDSNGDLVKVGPVHIGTTAPNANPATTAATALVAGTIYQILTVGTTDFTLVGAGNNNVGTVFTATGAGTGTGTVSGQQGVEKGEQWLDTTGGTYVLKIYDGTAWRSESGTFVDSAGDTMTGALLLDNAASAAAPDLSFDGDADTGIYSPGANQVAVSTTGTGRLFIDSSGNIGVGTSSFSGKFYVLGDATNYGITSEAPSGYGSLTLKQTSGNSMSLGMASNNLFVYDNNAGLARLTLDSSGRLLVGTTTSIDSTSKVQIKDGYLNVYHDSSADQAGYGIRFSTNGGATGRTHAQISLSQSAGAGGNLLFSTTADGASSPTERMRIDSSGNVFIGGSSNAALDGVFGLVVGGSSKSDVGVAVEAGTSQFLIYTSSTDQALNFWDARVNSVRMRIDSSGRLLVGTTTEGEANADNLTIADTGNCGLTLRSGSTNNGAIYFSDSTTGNGEFDGYIDYNQSTSLMRFGTASTSRVVIDSTGNVGIGLSASLSGLCVNNTIRSQNTSSNVSYIGFTSYTGTTAVGGMFSYIGGDGRSTGYLNFSTNDTERMRIDSVGRLLVGTTSARTNIQYSGSNYTPVFQIEGTDASDSFASITRKDGFNASLFLNGGQSVLANRTVGSVVFNGYDGTNYVNAARVEAQVDGTPGANDMPGRLVFSTTADGASSPTERMRIKNYGQVYTYSNSVNAFAIASSGATTAPNACIYLQAGATGVDTGTITFKVLCNGNVQNANNSYTAISDVKLKENIVDANSQWSDIKAIQVRNYNYKEETGIGTHTQIGVIAQEIESVSPGLVIDVPDVGNDGIDPGTTTKSVNYSVLYMKAVKALQEAMDRIETLEAKVAALEAE